MGPSFQNLEAHLSCDLCVLGQPINQMGRGSGILTSHQWRTQCHSREGNSIHVKENVVNIDKET